MSVCDRIQRHPTFYLLLQFSVQFYNNVALECASIPENIGLKPFLFMDLENFEGQFQALETYLQTAT